MGLFSKWQCRRWLAVRPWALRADPGAGRRRCSGAGSRRRTAGPEDARPGLPGGLRLRAEVRQVARRPFGPAAKCEAVVRSFRHPARDLSERFLRRRGLLGGWAPRAAGVLERPSRAGFARRGGRTLWQSPGGGRASAISTGIASHRPGRPRRLASASASMLPMISENRFGPERGERVGHARQVAGWCEHIKIKKRSEREFLRAEGLPFGKGVSEARFVRADSPHPPAARAPPSPAGGRGVFRRSSGVYGGFGEVGATFRKDGTERSQARTVFTLSATFPLGRSPIQPAYSRRLGGGGDGHLATGRIGKGGGDRRDRNRSDRAAGPATDRPSELASGGGTRAVLPDGGDRGVRDRRLGDRAVGVAVAQIVSTRGQNSAAIRRGRRDGGVRSSARKATTRRDRRSSSDALAGLAAPTRIDPWRPQPVDGRSTRARRDDRPIWRSRGGRRAPAHRANWPPISRVGAKIDPPDRMRAQRKRPWPLST